MAARPWGAAGWAGGAEYPPLCSPPPPARLSARSASFPVQLGPHELRAARPGREGAETRTAPGGARTNLAGWATPAACPAPKSETPGWSWRGRARRLPGAAEPLRSPRYPFSVRPTRSAPLEASPPHSVAGGGCGTLSRYLSPGPLCPPWSPDCPGGQRGSRFSLDECTGSH